MAAITAKIHEQDTGASLVSDSPFGHKEVLAVTPNTADPADTFTVTLANFGITTFKSIRGFVQSAAGVLEPETPTTAVSAGVLTVTLGGGDNNLARYYVIGGQ